MSVSANPFIPLYKTITAPLYFSAILSTAFYGVTCMQTFFYYVHYPNDSQWMKGLVAVLWALDTIHEALTVAGVYKHIMACLISPLAILNVTPELILQTLTTVLIGIPTQAYFVHRIYVFSRKNIVAPLLWILPTIYQLVGALIYVMRALYSADGSVHAVDFLVLDDSFFKDIIISSLSVAAAVDVVIAIAMTFLLLRQKNATGFASTAHVLQRLTMFAVNTGIWTATFAVLSAILMHVLPSNCIYVVFAIPISSIYCNTLLANLNARAYLRGETTALNGGADVVRMNSPMYAGSEKQSRETQLTSPTHLQSVKATEAVTFMGHDWSLTQQNNV